ncbi:hypothetical protein Tco_0925965 [Tanacetum coccineum]|uniref:Uncharacterized protein n=1 Tax=Tanacetum coccineum TaxID=301880 RepID=A0ABQ5D8E6_9ASTR
MRTSSNTWNQSIVHNGRVVVQNVQGRQNRVQGNNARGVVAVGNGGAQNRAGNANVGQGKPIKCYNCNRIDEGPVQDMAQNEDNIFQADQCDAFDSDIDEAPTTQTLFMANLSSTKPVYDEVGPSYDSDTLYVVQDHDNSLDNMNEYHKEHKMQNDYVQDNKAQVVQSDASFVPNDAVTMITNDIYEQDAQCVIYNQPNKTVNASLTIELARYKELAEEFDKTYKKRITPTGLIEEERGFEQRKTCYLTEVIPFFKTIKEHYEGIQKALINEIKEMKEVFDQMEAEVDQHVVDKKCDKIKRKNFLIENENLIAECLSKYVFYTATDFVLTVSRFSDMHDAYIVAQKLIVELEAENSNLTQKIQKDAHDEMINHFSKLEVEHLNLQLKYQHLKEQQLQGRGNTIRELKEKISRLQKKHGEAYPILGFKALDSQNKYLNAKVNALQDLNERFRAENKKVKQHYKELYDSIKLTHAKTIEKTTSLLTEIETLKAQIKGKTKCVTMPDPMKPKVLAPGTYAIDVEPIPPRNGNNREVHLDYLKHLKESVGTLREIVEEARVEKPLDSSLASACLYPKHSQERENFTFSKETW